MLLFHFQDMCSLQPTDLTELFSKLTTFSSITEKSGILADRLFKSASSLSFPGTYITWYSDDLLGLLEKVS